MALRLRVISEHRRPLGERGTMTFGVAGGTIGRSSDNDWVLPDPQRYVSAHHARIHFRDGQYQLEDTSTNGLYVNDDERPVSAYGPYPLQHGDVLRLGEYQLAVALEPETAGSATVTALDPVPTHIHALQGLGRAAQTDLGASLNLDELLVSESSSGRRMGPVNAYGQAVAARPAPGATTTAASAPEPEDGAIARRIERLARAASRTRDARGTALPVPHEVQTGLEAFCRGAGVDMSRLPADAQPRLLHLVGQLLREALVGLKDLERARDEIRGRFHIELPADPEDPRPSLVRSAVEELLIEVLSQHDSRRLDAVQWIREAVETAKAHERAASEAFRAAFVEFIDRFDPAELEARFQRAARRGTAPGSSEARNWALFVEFYRSLTEMPAGRLPPTFVEAFASAYKKALLAAREPTP
ncbi:MAG: type VI secretion system-associated FHA domain protein TagH [Steroidobacteraceae bacterium]